MTHLFLVRVDDPFDRGSVRANQNRETLRDEILSNLDSCSQDGNHHIDYATLTVVDDVDLRTLFTAAMNATPALECSAALANYTAELLTGIGLKLPDINDDRETDLDRFNEV